MTSFRFRSRFALGWVTVVSGALLAMSIMSAAQLQPTPLLLPGDTLESGQWLSAGSGALLMASDGDLVVCKHVIVHGNVTACSPDTPPLWSAGTSGNPGAYAVMQEFGCLSVFPAKKNGQDSSSSSGSPNLNTPLGFSNDSNDPTDPRLWQSHTMAACGCQNSDRNCGYVSIEQTGNVVLRQGPSPQHAGSVVWETQTRLPPAKARNVLYFLVDDLRPEMNLAYGQPDIVTPNFDRLAQRGLVFTRAYCQIAVCAPSRNSFMSGLRPDVTAIYNFKNHIREDNQPDITTMPQAFKEAGWTTLGGGKTFHMGLPPDFDRETSWSASVQPYYPFLEFVGSSDFAKCPNKASACAVDGSMEQFYDYRLANHTIATLQRAAAMNAPFFIMAGFRRPHRDFFVHRDFWNLYPRFPAAMRTAKYQKRDASQPEVAFHAAGCTLPNGTTIPGNADEPWPLEVQRWFKTGYYAAVSQTDAQVGRVLDELERLGLENDTVVILHADHGWQLGEHGLWDKQTEFELATRVPLIIAAPHKPASHGKRTDALAELVDMHPTVQSLAGIDHPVPPVTTQFIARNHTQGTDLSPIFDAPATASVKSYAVSQFPNCGLNNTECMACTGPRSFRTSLAAMGYSVRTAEWRYTLYVPFDNATFTGDFDAKVPPLGEELYDHRGAASVVMDFDEDGEAINVAQNPENAEVVRAMRALLRQEYSYDSEFLETRRQRFLWGQQKYEHVQGWAFDATN